MSHFLPFEAGFGGRSSDRLAKINERLKLGKPGRALNGDLWVLQSPDQKCDLERDGEDKAE